MAANLSGMFAQLNQAVQNNPLATGTGTDMLDMASKGAGNVLASMPGQSKDPYSFMTEGAKLRQGTQDLAGLDLSNTADMEQAAGIYAKMGKDDKALGMAQMAMKQKQAEAQLVREQKLRETLATQAAKLGMEDYAKQISTGALDLEEASKTVKDAELEELLITRGIPGRKVIAKRHGITEDEFQELGLDKFTDDQFKDFTQGMGAETEAFVDAKGNPFMGRVNAAGKVWDKDAQAWRNPSEMGIQAAPQVSRVHNVSNAMVEKLALDGIDNFTELHKAANEAVEVVDNVNRNLPLIDNMPTGLGAEVSLFAQRVATMLGDDPSQASVNAQVYMADAGKRTANAITAFGAGTGLSDKDREYAEQMAAGKITVDGPAMKKILRIQRDAAQGIIDHFSKTKSTVEGRLPQDERGVMDLYTLKNPRISNPDTTPAIKTYNPTTGTFE